MRAELNEVREQTMQPFPEIALWVQNITSEETLKQECA
jgi:hypothetical protein